MALAAACIVGLATSRRPPSRDHQAPAGPAWTGAVSDPGDAAGSHKPEVRNEGLPPVDLAACDRDTDVFGLVVDRAGKGISGARVGTVFRPWGPLVREAHGRLKEFREGATTTTSTDGSFRIPVPRGSVLGLWARKPGYAEAQVRSCLAGERVQLTLQIGANVRVIVSDDKGRPVPGVEVGWDQGFLVVKAESQVPVLTGADGSCVLENLPIDEGTRIRACDRRTGLAATDFIAASADGEKVARITLSPEQALQGLVLDAAGRKPIGGAQVGWISPDEASGRTDAEGRFTLSKSGLLCILVLVQAEGYVQELVDPKPDRMEVLLHKSALLTGRLVDPSGAPVAGGRVLVSWYDDAGNGPTTMSDPEGRFRIGGFPSDRWCEVSAWREESGKFSFRFFLGEGHTEVLDLGDLVLPRSLAIEGCLLDRKGKPTPGTNVTLSGGMTDYSGNSPPNIPSVEVNRTSTTCRTDDLGRFRFHDLAPGRYTVWCQRPDGPGASVEVGLRERDALGIELRMPQGRVVTVRVVDEGGNPMKDVPVDSTEFLQIGWGRTGEDGTAAMVLDGSGQLEVRAPDGYLPVRSQRVPETQNEVVFTLEKSQTIRGKVEGIAPDTGKYGSVYVRAFDGSKECASSKVGDGGTFALTVRAGCVVDLLAKQVIGERPPFRVRSARAPSIGAGASDVTLQLEEVPLNRTLRVRVLDAAGRPVPGVRVVARSPLLSASELTAADGRVELSGLPDRPMNLRAFVEDPKVTGGTATPLENVVPRGQEIELHIPANDIVTGIIVGSSGEPIRGAEVKLLQADNEFWEAMAVSDSSGEFRLEFSPVENPRLRIEVEAEMEGAGLLVGSLEKVKPGDSGLLIHLHIR